MSAHILPGDQLWNRYRVEQIDAGAWEAAWLSPLERTTATPARYLLVPLDGRSNHPLAPLLSAVCSSTRIKPPLPPQSGNGSVTRLSRASSRRAPARELSGSAFETFPLLGGIEWIGEAGHGGVAVVAAPPVTPLSDYVRHGQLSPAQVLPIFLDLARSLDALLTSVSTGVNRPSIQDDLLIAAAHVLNPDNLGLRQGDGHLALKAGLAKASPAHWPEWTDFIAPELFSESEPTPAAWVFSAARIAAFLLGCRGEMQDFDTGASSDSNGRSVPRDAAAWAALSAWASGKRDPAKEFLHAAKECDVPLELCDVLYRSLSRRPNRRPSNPGKLISAVKRLNECGWARSSYSCPGCGRNLTPIQVDRETLNCPACGRDLPLPGGPGKNESERGGGSGGGRPSRRGTTAVYKQRGGSTSAALSAVAAPAGMILVTGGSFLSGERKIPRTLRPFAVDTTPVTEGEYKKFLVEIGATPRAGGPGSRSARYDRHPVTQVSWYEANEFAEHYGKRLPTIYEWEKAARGADGRRFPYGNTFKSGCGRLRAGGEAPSDTERRTSPVGTFPDGASPFGVLDMAGNVLEWTSTARRAGERLFRAVKGACYLDGSPELARCTSVQYIRPECSELYLGFRCVKDLE